MVIKWQDARACGYCARGIRAFCADNNIELDDFRKNGIELSKVQHLDDAMVNRIIEETEKRYARER